MCKAPMNGAHRPITLQTSPLCMQISATSTPPGPTQIQHDKKTPFTCDCDHTTQRDEQTLPGVGSSVE